MDTAKKITQQLLKDIDKYCEDTGISVSEFGEAALGDRGFVFDLRRQNRSPRLVTLDKVQNYIADNPPKSTEAAQ